MISSENERDFIRDLSNLTLKIIFVAWWASMNVGSKRPIAWNDSRHVPSGDSIYTVGSRSTAAQESYASFVITYFAIHQPMGPAQPGNTCCQKLTSQS